MPFNYLNKESNKQTNMYYPGGGNSSMFINGSICVWKSQENYSKTCLKRPIKNRQNKGLNDTW